MQRCVNALNGIKDLPPESSWNILMPQQFVNFDVLLPVVIQNFCGTTIGADLAL